jgi:hypothetical protein
MTNSETTVPYSESRITESLQGFSQAQRRLEEQVGLLFAAYRSVYDRLALEFPQAYDSPQVAVVDLNNEKVILRNDTVVTFAELYDIDGAAVIRRNEMRDEIRRRMHQRETYELEELEERVNQSGLRESGAFSDIERLLELRLRYPHVVAPPAPRVELTEEQPDGSTDGV